MTWKLLSDIIAAKMCRHAAHYMSRAQKGVGIDTEEPNTSYWLAGQLFRVRMIMKPTVYYLD